MAQPPPGSMYIHPEVLTIAKRLERQLTSSCDRAKRPSIWKISGEPSIARLFRAGDGDRGQTVRLAKGTKKEANAELTRLINAAHQGEYIDPAKTTLGEFLDRWLRDWAAINVGAKTLERYKRTY